VTLVLDQQCQRYPSFLRMVRLVGAENPFQRRQIEAFLAQQGPAYWEFAEQLLSRLDASFFADEAGRLAAARCYNRLCMDYVREQIVFRKTGRYPVDSARAYQTVYSRPEVMRYYMIGLLLTYLFWPNQYGMFRFFCEHVATLRIRRYLEVGVGHGLFVAEVLRQAPEFPATLVDISETSIAVARELLGVFQADLGRTRFVHGDFLTVSLPPAGFDFVVLGEVLEHVDDAPQFLRRAKELLSPDGSMYV
jgi:2-polyprenyl-3-methyl-5-hydroxy-6-metoxy-1,4-benzoquinol methylase